jgi:hypothetical protein
VRLRIPAAWKALSNGVLVSRDSSEAAVHLLSFAETQPISTYLLSFAAGELQEERAERDGRSFTMYHRETDAAKVRRNAPAIFDLHAASLKWLEEYTGIPYPFGKFDFFAVPAFQFGGMEHPGAVWYRADALFLDESPSRTQELGRASLIAHETAQSPGSRFPGEGEFRGGDGLIREVEFREAMTAAILSNHRRIAPFGLAGGEPGRRGVNRLLRRYGPSEALQATAEIAVDAGDRLRIETPGGGGWGAPVRRDD